jgi:hypothetical protein
MSLTSIISDINFNREMYEKKMPIDPAYITAGDSIAIFRHIETQLSPEWLYEDGEASAKEVESKYDKLVKAATTLVKRGYKLSERDTTDLYYTIYTQPIF